MVVILTLHIPTYRVTRNRLRLHLWLRLNQTIIVFLQLQPYCNVAFVGVVAVGRGTVGIVLIGIGSYT